MKNKSLLARIICIAIATFVSRNGLAQGNRAGQSPITTTPLKPSGVYSVNEKIGWKVVAASGAVSGPVNYTIKSGGLTVMKQGTLDLSSGSAMLETTFDQPGSILVELRVPQPPTTQPQTGRRGRGAGNGGRILVGAMVEPRRIQPSMPRPDDFDAWWDAKIKELQLIPANARLEPVDSGNPEIELNDIVMDNVQGKRIYGQIARPKRDGKFPAVLQLQWAGVYALQRAWVVDKAKLGYLAMNIEPHDIPGNRDAAFYTEAGNTTLRDYYHIGNDDREKSYFLPMYLGDYRAVEYLSQRPDWDGKTLLVMGTSMGGQQTIVTAGLQPGKVTAISACVPSSCDATAPKSGRASGFPDWAQQADQKKDDRIYQTARYFDPMNFASRIKCPAQVAMGFIDETCPPAGVWAMINQIKSPVEIVPMIDSPHQDNPRGVQRPYQDRSDVWLRAIAAGQTPPIDQALFKP